MLQEKGLIHAILFDGKGGGRELGWQEIAEWSPEQGVLWMHLSCTAPEAIRWLEEQSGLEALLVDALLSEGTRPRSTVIGDGVLLTLRGVNHNPGEDHEDMVSIRIWAEQKRIITTRRRKLLSVTGLVGSFSAGQGPATSGEFINTLAELLTEYIEETVEGIEDQTSELEEQVVVAHDRKLRSRISGLRRQAIMLRRYLAPQREAFTRMQVEKIHWFSEQDKRHLYETANSLIRIVEDLDSLRERANVAQEELINLLSEQINSRMYTLSLVTTIFLPLSFFTGLLGINVGGIPGAANPWAFLIVIALLLGVCFVQFLYFRKKHWL
ncbi:zinc transporter ZntB [Desulfopila sp. IMCC35006]|nr:zinc transporter ZntB [Desulfopila sp. IMCC35006]